MFGRVYRASASFADIASGTLTTMEQEELTRRSQDALDVHPTQEDIDTGIKNRDKDSITRKR